MAEVVIIGAGLAGLSAAYHAYRAGIEHEVYEKEEKPGGLCRSHNRENVVFDYSGHLLHVKSPYFKEMVRDLLGDNIEVIKRKAFIFSHGVFTRYPFQINLYGLPPLVIKECLLGFVKSYSANRNLPRNAYANFHEWIVGKLGDGIARQFMIPYNEKLWTVPTEELTCQWLSEYVPQPTLEEVFGGTFSDNKNGIGYNATFWYPKKGGIQSLSDSLSLRVPKIRVNEKAIRIRVKEKVVEFESGRSAGYKTLISTMPLKELVGILDGPIPEKVREASAKLRHNSLLILNFAVRGTGLTDKHWVYLPEKGFKAYRIGGYANISTGMAPPGITSYYAEIAYRKDVPVDKDKALEDSIGDLIKIGFLGSRNDILVKEVLDVDHAYVIYDIDWMRCRKTIMDYLNNNDISTIGRYGNWEYSGMEEALAQGRDVIRSFKAVEIGK